MKKLLIIDNYDSFTWNLYQYFSELGVKVIIYRNDRININDLIKLMPDYLVISPGPGTPDQSGISVDAICYFAGKIPILGVCLGHQVIGQVFGANIIRAKNIMHGKTCFIYHDGLSIFTNIKQPLRVMRYNSLLIDPFNFPSCLIINAWSNGKLMDINYSEIMAIRHNDMQIYGIQFHPESIMSEQGHLILKNFIS